MVSFQWFLQRMSLAVGSLVGNFVVEHQSVKRFQRVHKSLSGGIALLNGRMQPLQLLLPQELEKFDFELLFRFRLPRSVVHSWSTPFAKELDRVVAGLKC
jgi:hypothetical protein